MHCLKECTWPIFFPFLLLVQLCWYRVRPAQSCIHNFLTTCSPCSHIFFSLPLSGCEFGWAAAARQQNSTARAALLLHGYKHPCSAIGSKSAELATHWLNEQGKTELPLAAGTRQACWDWPGSAVPRILGDSACVNILVVSFNGSVFTSSSALPVWADWGRASLRSRVWWERG